jgi:CheY-like chemotaxis protein
MTTILVVDDSSVDRRLVGGLLEKKFQWTIEYAANGVEALARMQSARADLVVTDLNMPVMDGLELVRSMRVRHPEVPIILMTAYGSEYLALEALEQGAASYVPKSQIAQRLPNTVESVLSVARAGRSHEYLLRCLRHIEFSFCLESDAGLIDPLIDLVQQMVSGTGLCDFAGRLQIGIALKESLLNALFHGSLEITKSEMEAVEHQLLGADDASLVEKRRVEAPYCDRRIFVDLKITPDEARFVLRDQGPGFDVRAGLAAAEQKSLEGETGRGLSLMRAFMDQVEFNEAGNEVTLVKRRAAVPAPVAAASP